MSRLQDAWRKAAKKLDLEIVVPFEVATKEFTVKAEVLLKNFGAPLGMLIVTDADAVEAHRKALIKLGYGFVTMEQPDGDYAFDHEEQEVFIEMLDEWGWMGKRDEEPEWLP